MATYKLKWVNQYLLAPFVYFIFFGQNIRLGFGKLLINNLFSYSPLKCVKGVRLAILN